MESTIIENILNNILENQQDMLRHQSTLQTNLTAIDEKLAVLLEQSKEETPDINLELLKQDMVKQITARIDSYILMLQQSHHRNNNLRIFLESDSKKWIVWMVLGFVFMTYLYWIIKR